MAHAPWVRCTHRARPGRPEPRQEDCGEAPAHPTAAEPSTPLLPCNMSKLVSECPGNSTAKMFGVKLLWHHPTALLTAPSGLRGRLSKPGAQWCADGLAWWLPCAASAGGALHSCSGRVQQNPGCAELRGARWHLGCAKADVKRPLPRGQPRRCPAGQESKTCIEDRLLLGLGEHETAVQRVVC